MNESLPCASPFLTELLADSNLLFNLLDENVSSYLAKPYYHGTILGKTISESDIGRQYVEDFLNFIRTQATGIKKDRVHALEIASRSGYLLYRLKLVKFYMLAIEPGR